MSGNDKDGGVQYLTFVIEDKLFAFDVLKTREVLSLVSITPIPGTPAHMIGVLNLRGSVVPVIDLRRKFGLTETPYTENTAIIIVESNYGDEIIIVGALVDAVKGVKVFEKNQIEPPPKIGMKLNLDMIHAIGKTEKDFTLILNIDKVLSDEDVTMARELFENADKEQPASE